MIEIAETDKSVRPVVALMPIFYFNQHFSIMFNFNTFKPDVSVHTHTLSVKCQPVGLHEQQDHGETGEVTDETLLSEWASIW